MTTICTRCRIEDDLFIVGIKAYCGKCFLQLSKEQRMTECFSCKTESNCFLKGVNFYCEGCIEYNLCQTDNVKYCVECNNIDTVKLFKIDTDSNVYMCIDCGKNIYKRTRCDKCKVYHINTICIFDPLKNGGIHCNTCKRYHEGTCKHCSLCMKYVPFNWEHCELCGDCGPADRIH